MNDKQQYINYLLLCLLLLDILELGIFFLNRIFDIFFSQIQHQFLISID